jgi:uncharacterized membrane protein YsdA (DUF1294 family)
MKPFILVFLFFNLVAFFIFGLDKFFALTNRQRIRENTLLILAIAGGSVGAIFAQKIFRHKIRKLRYILWIILIVQFIVFEVLWYYLPMLSQTTRTL